MIDKVETPCTERPNPAVPPHIVEASKPPTRPIQVVGVAIALLAAGCGAAPALERAGGPGTPTVPSLVFAASASADERQPAMGALFAAAVRREMDAGNGSLRLVVDRPGGPAPVGDDVDLVLRRGPEIEHSPARRQTLADRKAADIAARVTGLGGSSGHIDPVGLLIYIGRLPGPVTATVVGSGLQDVGPLAVDAVGWDHVGTDAEIDMAQTADSSPTSEARRSSSGESATSPAGRRSWRCRSAGASRIS